MRKTFQRDQNLAVLQRSKKEADQEDPARQPSSRRRYGFQFDKHYTTDLVWATRDSDQAYPYNHQHLLLHGLSATVIV